MDALVFIGDELSAAGFRLAGAVVHTPEPGAEGRIFSVALREAQLIVISAGQAARIPPKFLHRAITGGRPPVVVIPDARARVRPPDLAARLRRQLGIAP